jgi:hypothetical protein
MMIPVKSLVVLLFPAGVMLSISSQAQTKIDPQDSIIIKQRLEEFYSRYIDLTITHSPRNGFEPIFEKKDDGMTTLGFKEYKDNLRKYLFTESFIRKKVSSYQACTDNLKKIPFDTLITFNSLDKLENIQCDFMNRYEWTGGQEPKELAILHRMNQISRQTIIAHIALITDRKPSGNVIVTLTKTKQLWEISDLTVE